MPEKRNQHLLRMVENGEGFGLDPCFPDVNWEQRTQWLRNRWPRVIFENPGKWELTLQLAIRDNVVIQQLVLRNYSELPVDLQHSVFLDVLIRELDFVNHSEFNYDTNKNHAEGPGPGGFGYVKLYRLPENKPSSENLSEYLNPDAVAAVIGVFINGEAWMKDQNEEISITVASNSECTLVAGYKLMLLSTQRENWKQLLLTKEDVDIDGLLWDTQPPADIPRDTFLFNKPFYVGRNVEHILTVCAIPITEGPVWDYEPQHTQNLDEEDKSPVIALTCGDMAGHRICSSGS